MSTAVQPTSLSDITVFLCFLSCRHAHTVGGDASQGGLEEARNDFHNRLKGHIIRPLEQWSEGLSAVEVRGWESGSWL
jgi:hypothetical protein